MQVDGVANQAREPGLWQHVHLRRASAEIAPRQATWPSNHQACAKLASAMPPEATPPSRSATTLPLLERWLPFDVRALVGRITRRPPRPLRTLHRRRTGARRSQKVRPRSLDRSSLPQGQSLTTCSCSPRNSEPRFAELPRNPRSLLHGCLNGSAVSDLEPQQPQALASATHRLGIGSWAARYSTRSQALAGSTSVRAAHTPVGPFPGRNLNSRLRSYFSCPSPHHQRHYCPPPPPPPPPPPGGCCISFPQPRRFLS